MVLQLNFVKYISCSNNRSNSICNLRHQSRHFIQQQAVHQIILFSQMKTDKIFQNGISWNISSTEVLIKSYSSHKWKQTKFSKTKYLEIFLQLRCRNRQYIPKQNLLWQLVNIFPVQYTIQEVSYFGCSSCSKVPFVLLARQSMMNIQHNISICV